VAFAVVWRFLFRFLCLFFPAADPPILVRPNHVGPSGHRVRYIGPPMERAELERRVMANGDRQDDLVAESSIDDQMT